MVLQTSSIREDYCLGSNREQPVSDKFSSVLRISDGNLVLLSESKTPIWSANQTSSSTSASIHALLLGSGNFVLLKAGSTSEFLWQSFDFPTHTWLPGSRLGFNIVSQQTQILNSWKSYEDPVPGLFSLQLDPGSTAIICCGIGLHNIEPTVHGTKVLILLAWFRK